MLIVLWYPLCSLLPVLYPLYVCTIVFCMYIHLCTIVFCMYIHCNHCMHCCVYSQGGIGNRRKQLEKENKCARATWLPQPPPLCSSMFYTIREPPPPPLCSTQMCFTNSDMRLCVFSTLCCTLTWLKPTLSYAHMFTQNHYVLRSCV